MDLIHKNRVKAITANFSLFLRKLHPGIVEGNFSTRGGKKKITKIRRTKRDGFDGSLVSFNCVMKNNSLKYLNGTLFASIIAAKLCQLMWKVWSVFISRNISLSSNSVCELEKFKLQFLHKNYRKFSKLMRIFSSKKLAKLIGLSSKPKCVNGFLTLR